MAKKTLETIENPQVIVDGVGTDLQVKGWDRLEVLVKSSSDNEITLEEQDGVIRVGCPSDCVLYVPQKARVEIKQVGSNARFRALDGEIAIEKVGTDLSLRDVDSAQVGTVGTDFSARSVRDALTVEKVGSSALVKDVGAVELDFVGNQLVAKRVRGDLKVDQVGGSVVVRDIDGQVSFDSVGGSMHLQEVSGGIQAQVSGSATVDFAPVSWQAYSIQAAGNIRCQIPADADAAFEITSGAERIRIKSAEGKETIKENTHTLTLGEGGAAVKLVAGGGVDIISRGTGLDNVESFEFDFDFGTEFESLADEIAEQTTQHIEAQMEMLEEQLNVQLAGLSTTLGTVGMSEERVKAMEERLAQAKERSARRAAESSKRAQERLERKLAAAQRKAERKARASAAREARKQRAHTDYGAHSVVITSPPARQAAKDPVSEEERMMILQMLQDKKISVEQAEQLLSALEGK